MIFAIIPCMKELPKDCSYCDLVYDDMYCMALDLPEARELNYDGRRPTACPLFEVK